MRHLIVVFMIGLGGLTGSLTGIATIAMTLSQLNHSLNSSQGNGPIGSEPHTTLIIMWVITIISIMIFVWGVRTIVKSEA